MIMLSLSVRTEEKNGEELGTFFTSTSSRHPLFPHQLVFNIGEVVEPTISLEIITHVLEVRGPDI